MVFLLLYKDYFLSLANILSSNYNTQKKKLTPLNYGT